MIAEAHITINASKAAVWAATTDIARFAELLTGVEKIEVVEKPASGLVGLKWKETRMLFGKEATVEKWITEAKENEHYTTRAEQDGFVFITTNRISGSDGSVVLTGIHVTQPQGFAAKLKALPMVFFKGVIKKAILQDLNDIKKNVERDQAAAALVHPWVDELLSNSGFRVSHRYTVPLHAGALSSGAYRSRRIGVEIRDSLTQWGPAPELVKKICGDLKGLWFYAGWIDQAVLHIGRIESADSSFVLSILSEFDIDQVDQSGDMLVGFFAPERAWLLLIEASPDNGTFTFSFRTDSSAHYEQIQKHLGIGKDGATDAGH